MIVMRRSANASPVRSYLVEILQASLAAKGLDIGTPDGELGPQTEKAIKLWQVARGQTANGIVDDAAWQAITGLPPPSLFDRVLHIVAQFEGTGLGGVAGNFDGAYLTFGIIGFTLKHDLPGLLEAIEKKVPQEARHSFGVDKWKELLAVARSNKASTKKAFGDSISVGAQKYKVVESWRQAFARLGRVRTVQELQLQRAFSKYMLDIAIPDGRELKAIDTMDMAVMYDLAVQNGGLDAKKRQKIKALIKTKPNAAGEQRRKLWAKGIAQGLATPTYYADVLSRKLTMSTGIGTVHGANLDLSCWGLESAPIDIETLKNEHFTVAPTVDAAPPAPGPAFAPAMESAGVRPRGIAAPAVFSAAPSWTQEVAVPADLNQGLTAVNNGLMARIFGAPRSNYDQHCRPPQNAAFKARCTFGVRLDGIAGALWGLTPAVESLKRVLADIKAENPEIFAILGHQGMGCCRFQRNSSTKISNHSWGAAVDLTINGQLDVRGNDRMQRGVLAIAPIFKRHKWYSGATFRTEDAMHMEVSREWLKENIPGISVDDDRVSGFLTVGDSGPEVRELQRLLNNHGAGLTLDGDFGAATVLALKAFQGRRNLIVDGVAGPSVMTALRSPA